MPAEPLQILRHISRILDSRGISYKLLPSLIPSFKGITSFAPFSSRTASQTLNAAPFLAVAESSANHVAAHARTFALNLAKRE
jgi:hypothetical protein